MVDENLTNKQRLERALRLLDAIVADSDEIESIEMDARADVFDVTADGDEIRRFDWTGRETYELKLTIRRKRHEKSKPSGKYLTDGVPSPRRPS